MIKQIKALMLPLVVVLFTIFGFNSASLSAGYDMGYGDHQLYAAAPVYGGQKGSGFSEGAFLSIFWAILSVIVSIAFIGYCIIGCFTCFGWLANGGMGFLSPVKNCYSGRRRHHCGHDHHDRHCD